MSVCKFFLDNRCRYGESCRFEHPRGAGGGAQRNLFGSGGGGGTNWGSNSGQKVTFHDSFGTSSNQGGNNQFKWVANNKQVGQSNSQPASALDLVNALPKEMEMWEKTKMWPFSCVSLERDSPSLPDFIDTSVEELRLEYYEAQKTGNTAAYIQRVQNLVTEFQNKRMQLKQLNIDLKQKLIMFAEQSRKNKANQGSSNVSSTIFGQSPAASTSQRPGIFGQSPGSGGLFGKPSGGVGGMFGSQTATTQATLFGKPQGSGGLFSQNQTSGSLFGGQSLNVNQNQTSGSVFGNSQQPSHQTSSVFGASSGAPSNGLFGKPAAATSATGVFGSAATSPSPGLFSSGPSSTPNIFGQMSSPTSATPTPGLFGTPSNPSQTQPGLFGNASGMSAPSGGDGLLPTPSSLGGTGLFGKGAMPSSGGLVPTQPTGLFGKGQSLNDSSTSTGLFGKTLFDGGTSPGAGLFGKGLSSIGGNAMGAGLFGKSPSSPASTMTGTQGNVLSDANVNKGRFSLMEELTEQDIKAFKASSFTLGKLPIKPPPRELVIL